jgi:hypothetical protein
MTSSLDSCSSPQKRRTLCRSHRETQIDAIYSASRISGRPTTKCQRPRLSSNHLSFSAHSGGCRHATVRHVVYHPPNDQGAPSDGQQDSRRPHRAANAPPRRVGTARGDYRRQGRQRYTDQAAPSRRANGTSLDSRWSTAAWHLCLRGSRYVARIVATATLCQLPECLSSNSRSSCHKRIRIASDEQAPAFHHPARPSF